MRLEETPDAIRVACESKTLGEDKVRELLNRIYYRLPVNEELQFLAAAVDVRPNDDDLWSRLAQSALRAGDFI